MPMLACIAFLIALACIAAHLFKRIWHYGAYLVLLINTGHIAFLRHVFAMLQLTIKQPDSRVNADTAQQPC